MYNHDDLIGHIPSRTGVLTRLDTKESDWCRCPVICRDVSLTKVGAGAGRGGEQRLGAFQVLTCDPGYLYACRFQSYEVDVCVSGAVDRYRSSRDIEVSCGGTETGIRKPIGGLQFQQKMLLIKDDLRIDGLGASNDFEIPKKIKVEEVN
ncbi:hypothetical protein EVAR_19092_1 [Eumeta japonica]|uniref:Uncharacterized protein n=1 Tax=Eumeta variegata TaxID=151549 RepID=A0A4C1UP46_EUMVA|nr:hypothetical protein EVAR_19092_1 [Eumeta japonica]